MDCPFRAVTPQNPQSQGRVCCYTEPMSENRPELPSRKSPLISLPARDAVLAGFERRFVEAQYVWTSFLLEHLVECRRRIGDLDSMLVLVVIGLAALREVQRVRELEGEHVALGYLKAEMPSKGGSVNAYSIANVTGIPRENVRRRLADLAQRGWIEQADDGGWRIRQNTGGPSKATTDLAELTANAVTRLADFIGRLSAISAAAMEDMGKQNAPTEPRATDPTKVAGLWEDPPREKEE